MALYGIITKRTSFAPARKSVCANFIPPTLIEGKKKKNRMPSPVTEKLFRYSEKCSTALNLFMWFESESRFSGSFSAIRRTQIKIRCLKNMHRFYFFFPSLPQSFHFPVINSFFFSLLLFIHSYYVSHSLFPFRFWFSISFLFRCCCCTSLCTAQTDLNSCRKKKK